MKRIFGVALLLVSCGTAGAELETLDTPTPTTTTTTTVAVEPPAPTTTTVVLELPAPTTTTTAAPAPAPLTQQAVVVEDLPPCPPSFINGGVIVWPDGPPTGDCGSTLPGPDDLLLGDVIEWDSNLP